MKATQTYSLLKATEGGVSQRNVIALLRSHGIKVRPTHSPYIGHYGIEVEGGKRVQAKVSRLLFRP